jgi:hypothetical protein
LGELALGFGYYLITRGVLLSEQGRFDELDEGIHLLIENVFNDRPVNSWAISASIVSEIQTHLKNHQGV